MYQIGLIYSPVSPHQISILTFSIKKHIKQARCQFLKYPLFFPLHFYKLHFSDYSLVQEKIKKRTTLWFLKIYKTHHYSEPCDLCWHVRTRRKSVHSTLGKRNTVIFSCENLLLNKYSITPHLRLPSLLTHLCSLSISNHLSRWSCTQFITPICQLK